MVLSRTLAKSFAATDILAATKPGEMHQPLFEHFYEEFRKGAQTGMDVQNLHALDHRHRDYELHKNIRRSAAEFAAAKTMALTQIMHDAPEVADANLKAYLRYTATEKRLVNRSARQALNWQEIQRESDLFPMLRYITANDARVRDSHRILHGVTLPIDDPFWHSWYPPNGYGCRCAVQQIHETAHIRPAALPTLAEAPEALRFNAGITQSVVSDNHPYYDKVGKREASKKTNDAISRIDIRDIIHVDGDAKVTAHPIHGEKELPQNLDISKRLASEGENTHLLPCINGQTNPDAILTNSNRIAEFETSHAATESSIRNRISDCIKQNAEVGIVVAMDIMDKGLLAKFVNAEIGLNHKNQTFNKLKEIWVYYKGKRYDIVIKKVLKGKQWIAFD